MDILIDIAKISGPIGISLIVIWLIVKENFKALQIQREEFMDVITNHLKEHSEAMNEMTIVIRELTGWLKKNNRK